MTSWPKPFVEAWNQWASQIYAGQTSHWNYGKDCWLSYPHSQELRVTKVQLPHLRMRLNCCLLSKRLPLVLLLSWKWKRSVLEPGNSACPNKSVQKPLENQPKPRELGLSLASLAFSCLSPSSHLPAPSRSCRANPEIGMWVWVVTRKGFQEKPARERGRWAGTEKSGKCASSDKVPAWGHGEIWSTTHLRVCSTEGWEAQLSQACTAHHR